MEKEKHPFIIKYPKKENYEYIGSDGLSINQTYSLYLIKCEEFREKAKKYAKHNQYLKNSFLKHTNNGYVSSQEQEEEVLEERIQHITTFKKAFNVTVFEEDQNTMYECLTGKSKRIRLIRELHKEKCTENSKKFNEKQTSWFTRFCILSRFIQAARKIILLNRLKKVLAILKTKILDTRGSEDYP